MNVGQLKSALAGLPDHLLVVLSNDAEGNGFSPLDELESDAHYAAASKFSGERYGRPSPRSVPAVFLWPVN